MDLSVIVPVFNEARLIIQTLQNISQFLGELAQPRLTIEIIVVDDGSTDDSSALIKNLNLPNLLLLQHQKNLGKGAAVKDGILAAKGEILLFLDADHSTNIDNLPIFLTKLKNADIVIASRALADSVIEVHQPPFKEKLGKLGNFFIRHLLVKDIFDTQCGFKVFKRACLPLFRMQKLAGWGFDFELLFLAKKHGYRIKEVGVKWRNYQPSKVKWFGYARTLLDIFLVRYYNLTGKYSKKPEDLRINKIYGN